MLLHGCPRFPTIRFLLLSVNLCIFELADSIRETIRNGVKVGLTDAKAGRTNELTDDYIET
jgi:hypothetical protein